MLGTPTSLSKQQRRFPLSKGFGQKERQLKQKWATVMYEPGSNDDPEAALMATDFEQGIDRSYC